MSKELSSSEIRRLSKSKLYTESEFLGLKGAENRRERLLSAVLDNREEMLNESDFRYLQLLKRAFNVMTDNLSDLLARRKVERLLDVSSRAMVRRIMADVRHIFMDNEDRNEKWERMVFEKKVSRLIDRLERKNPESKSIPDLYKLLAKIKGIDRHKEEAIPWEQWTLPIPVYTMDPNDIPDQPTIDVVHEELGAK